MEEIKVSEMLQADSIEKDNAVMIIQEGVNKKASGSIQTATGTSLSLTSVADTCKVKSNSKNLFDKDNYVETKLFINAGSSTYSEAGALYGAIMNVTNYTNLTLTKTKGTRFGIFVSTSYPAVGVSGVILQDSALTTSPKTIDVSSYNYMVVSFYSSSADTLSKSEILDTIQVEEGSTATEYNPYNTKVTLTNGTDIQNIVLTPQEEKAAFTYDIETTLTSNGSVTIEYNTQSRLLNNDDVLDIVEPVKEYIDRETEETYSTTEVKTNKTWIDGKPIYRKVITYNYAEGSTTASIPTGISNLDKVVLLNPIMLRSASDFEINYYSSSSDYLRTFYRYSTNAIEVRSSEASPNTVFYITIEYTKTTD